MGIPSSDFRNIMKTKHSMKTYVIYICFFFAFVVSIISGIFSAYNLHLGIDLTTTAIMKVIANVEHPTPNKPVIRPPFIVSSQWEDLPDSFHLAFATENIVNSRLLKKEIIERTHNGSFKKIVYLLIRCEFKSKIKYVAVKLSKSKYEQWSDSLHINLIPSIKAITMFIVIMLVSFLGSVFTLLYSIITPVNKLKNWAVHVQENNNLKNVPNFKFSELNMMADVISSNLRSLQEALSSEQEFTRYASDELRTPIAVIKANAELMKLIIDRNLPKDRLLNHIRRIDNNSKGMSHLCDSLLWLSQETNMEIQVQSTSFGLLIEQVVNEQKYLLEGKLIDVEIIIDQYNCMHLEVMCKIVIANLIRNAFQHTTQGKVIIKQKQQSLTIINRNRSFNISHEVTGFGLGLLIVRKICDKYCWEYSENILIDGRVVSINFV